MRLVLAVLLLSRIAFADPTDAPTKAELVPMREDEAVACLTCAADLKDCQAADRVSFKWVLIGTAAGLVVGALIGAGVYGAVKK